ncbi:MAG: hypothetical protein GH144_11220 [Clostridia bacterium]|jgi:hypothetical protein|nr:hypothetical protein [Clostridia bacterium]
MDKVIKSWFCYARCTGHKDSFSRHQRAKGIGCKMNSRERDFAAMNFRQTDRYPYFELGIWGQTYER